MNYRHIVLGLASGMLAAAPLAMFSPRSKAVELTDEERADCVAHGGCALVTRAKLDSLLEQAAKVGAERAKISCRNAI